MSDLGISERSSTDASRFKKIQSEDGPWFKTLRMTVNLLTSILIVLTVFVCLLFACNTPKITMYHMHIILCVLGYQFFMCQGTLVLSKYNSWSMFINRGNRRKIHVILQVIGSHLAIIGSCLIFFEKSEHFNTLHGSFGLAAFMTSAISSMNGFLVWYGHKFCSYTNIFWIKHFHFITGIGTLFLSAASLSAAFDSIAFSIWVNTEGCVPALIFLTWLFTILVAVDYWIVTGNRIRGSV